MAITIASDCKIIKHRSNKTHSVNVKNILKTAHVEKDLLDNADYTICITKPFIDKLTCTYAVTDKDLQETIKHSLWAMWTDPSEPVEKVALNKSNGHNIRYSHSAHFLHQGTGEKLLIQAGPKSNKNNFMRLEFNPEKLGREGIAFVRDRFLEISQGNLTVDDFLNPAKVTRLDVAVDLINVSLRDLLVTNTDADKYHIYFGAETGPETIYLGLKKTPKGKVGKSKQTAYNKRQEQKDKAEALFYNGIPHTRIEVHVERPKWKLNTLDKLVTSKNHLKHVELHFIEHLAQIPEQPHHWHLFADSCRHIGCEKALMKVPDGQLRKSYQNALNKALNKYWEPKEIWSAFPMCLERYDFAGTAPKPSKLIIGKSV